MIKLLAVICVSAVIFFATVISMALNRNENGITVRIAFLAALCGIISYSYGYSSLTDSFPVTVVRTVFSVVGMFMGRMDVQQVDSAPIFSNPIILSAFWFLHFLAAYILASVLMMTLGASILRHLRVRLLRRNDLAIIFGISDETILFASRLRDGRQKGETPVSILFVSDNNDSSLVPLIERNGWVIRSDSDALHPNHRFLRSIGIRKSDARRNITLYALSSEDNKNRRYACDLLTALMEDDIPDSCLSLTISTDLAQGADRLQARGGRYGYTDIHSFNLHSLTARLLMLEYPVWSTIHFREDGTAAEDVDVFIAGFGTTGQNVLLSIARNGQFEGSRFHAAVFASDIDSLAGYFFSTYEEFVNEYSIDFNRFDARSVAAAEYAWQHAHTLKYIIACTGDDKTDWEIIRNLQGILGSASKNILFLVCGKGMITLAGSEDTPDMTSDVWRNDILTASVADRPAKILNASYHRGSPESPDALWRVCAPFSKESCRAAADFMPAYCRIAGLTQRQAAAGFRNLKGELLENMARTEHRRWNAFHRTMGWKVMTEEEFDKRTRIYLSQKKIGIPPIRIAKNDAEKHHACLVSWEELAVLSEKENAVTGGSVDYQQYDRDNILAAPALYEVLAKD